MCVSAMTLDDSLAIDVTLSRRVSQQAAGENVETRPFHANPGFRNNRPFLNVTGQLFERDAILHAGHEGYRTGCVDV